MLNARKSLRSRLGTVVSVHMVTTTTDIDPCSEHGDVESGRRVGDSWSERIVVSDPALTFFTSCLTLLWTDPENPVSVSFQEVTPSSCTISPSGNHPAAQTQRVLVALRKYLDCSFPNAYTCRPEDSMYNRHISSLPPCSGSFRARYLHYTKHDQHGPRVRRSIQTDSD